MDFEHFIKIGEVKTQKMDESLSNILARESIERAEFVNRLVKYSENPKYIFENIYDAIRELIEAKLAKEGFKSYSHEATILFLKKFKEFNEAKIRFLDNIRKIRHGIKYYGKNISKEE